MFYLQTLYPRPSYTHDSDSKLCIEETGPSFDFEIKRMSEPSEEMKKKAFQEPANIVVIFFQNSTLKPKIIFALT